MANKKGAIVDFASLLLLVIILGGTYLVLSIAKFALPEKGQIIPSASLKRDVLTHVFLKSEVEVEGKRVPVWRKMGDSTSDINSEVGYIFLEARYLYEYNPVFENLGVPFIKDLCIALPFRQCRPPPLPLPLPGIETELNLGEPILNKEGELFYVRIGRIRYD